MAEPLKDIRKWLKKFKADQCTLAVGDSGLEIVVLDGENQVVGSYEIGAVPMADESPDQIRQFAVDPAQELIEDGMEPGCACGIAADAERIIRGHLPFSMGKKHKIEHKPIAAESLKTRHRQCL